MRLPLVVMAPGNPWEGNRFGQHHMATELSKHVRVLWVDPQISYLTPINDRDALQVLREDRLREVAPNIMRLSPVTVPGVTRPVLRDIAMRQARRAVRGAVDRLGGDVHALIVASLSDLLDIVPARHRVFFGTDDYVAGAALMGTDPVWLAEREQVQLTKASTVVAISPALREKWLPRRPDVHLIPNGCMAAAFASAVSAPRPADVALDGPIAGFVGHLSERIDLSMLEAVADTGTSLLLVGPRQPTFELAKVDALLARPNVQWVGPKLFAELPAYLGAIDVGLTPYTHSDFNHASFPLKTLEYLAAGRGAVVSDLPAHRWLDTPHITIADDPASFAAAAVSRLAAGNAPDDVADRQALGAQHSWASRADDLLGLLGLSPASSTTTIQKAA